MMQQRLVATACLRVVVGVPLKVPMREPPPLALREPPMLRSEARVVEEVTANVPVEVAPLVVSPPLNCTSVEVALPVSGKS